MTCDASKIDEMSARKTHISFGHLIRINWKYFNSYVNLCITPFKI